MPDFGLVEAAVQGSGWKPDPCCSPRVVDRISLLV